MLQKNGSSISFHLSTCSQLPLDFCLDLGGPLLRALSNLLQKRPTCCKRVPTCWKGDNWKRTLHGHWGEAQNNLHRDYCPEFPLSTFFRTFEFLTWWHQGEFQERTTLRLLEHGTLFVPSKMITATSINNLVVYKINIFNVSACSFSIARDIIPETKRHTFSCQLPGHYHNNFDPKNNF